MTDNTEREAPRVLGVEMVRSELDEHGQHNGNWQGEFGSLAFWLEPTGDTWDAFVAETCVAYNDTLTWAVATIEREILTIRDAIPAPEPKPCWSCGATLPGPSPEESKRKQEAWEAEQKGGAQ